MRAYRALGTGCLVKNPRETNGSWVADPGHHLANATVRSIDSVVSQLEGEKSVEMAVVVIDSLDGLDPADAALLLHRRWGVGKRQRDNGIVFSGRRRFGRPT